MKKIVQFAAAIITRPRILLLDNFFINLDIEVQKKIIILIACVKKNWDNHNYF